MKRFVICFDGTWQQLRQSKPTNIAIIARSIAHTNTLEDGTQIPQIVIYSQGVGSNTDALGKDGFVDGVTEWLNKMLGGVFGEGVEDNLVETYLRLAFNYEAGDEIYVFGFSRGAFCARSFAGLISSAGMRKRRGTLSVFIAHAPAPRRLSSSATITIVRGVSFARCMARASAALTVRGSNRTSR